MNFVSFEFLTIFFQTFLKDWSPFNIKIFKHQFSQALINFDIIKIWHIQPILVFVQFKYPNLLIFSWI